MQSAYAILDNLRVKLCVKVFQKGFFMKKIILALLIVGAIAGVGKYLNAEDYRDFDDSDIEIIDDLQQDGDDE